jgi:hypothetical protein
MTPALKQSPINQETITPKSNSLPEVHLPNNETTTPSVENPIINQETVTPKSDTVADVPSVHQVPNKNNSSSTPKITSHSKPPTAPFSFINLLRKAVDFFSNNNLPIAKKEEHDNRRSRAPDAFLPEGSSGSSASAAAPPSASPKGRSPVLFPDIISSKSQTDNNINRETDLSVPDSWSSITELINESYSTNNSLNAKSEKNKNIDRVITKSNNIFSIEKRHELSSSNTPKINQNNDRINILNKKKDALISNNLNIYQIQLKTNKSNYSRYQYQPLNSNITSSEKTSKTLSGKPSIQEVNNFTLSLKEETPAENKTLNNDTETTTNETEVLDILAGEIYNLLQQRLELERERQGKYYI